MMIARRLPDGTIEFKEAWTRVDDKEDARILRTYYDTPEEVERMFQPGRIIKLGKPGECEIVNEEDVPEGSGDGFIPSGGFSWIARSEDDLSKISGEGWCLYEQDEVWYEVIPRAIRIKFPVRLMLEYHGDADEFRERLERKVIRYMLEKYPRKDKKFALYLEQLGCADLYYRIKYEDDPMWKLWSRYMAVCGYFDGWAIIRPDKEGLGVGKVKLRAQRKKHRETTKEDVK